jgi:hypothetical protein
VIDKRPIGGALSVDESARRLIYYRDAEIACIEAAVGWAATIAAPKLKVSLAGHTYQDALSSACRKASQIDVAVVSGHLLIPPKLVTLRLFDLRPLVSAVKVLEDEVDDDQDWEH